MSKRANFRYIFKGPIDGVVAHDIAARFARALKCHYVVGCVIEGSNRHYYLTIDYIFNKRVNPNGVRVWLCSNNWDLPANTILDEKFEYTTKNWHLLLRELKGLV